MKKIKKKYELGSYVEPMAAASNMLGSAIGGTAGGALSGAGSGMAMGAIGGPAGMAIGAALGGIAGIIGGIRKKNSERKARHREGVAFGDAYQKQLMSEVDTNNENPYGIYADGGDIMDTQINIELGELQIDPTTGKIIREYKGINPETGGLYKPHSKGKDTNHNFVTATPGTFIIKTSEANNYKDAIDNNDIIRRNTILQNIKNYKDKNNKNDKMAFGSFVKPNDYALEKQYIPNVAAYIPKIGTPSLNNTKFMPVSMGKENGFNLEGGLDSVAKYGPGLINTFKGMFGKVETTPNVNPIQNPYKSQILNNMPQDVSLEPARQQLLRQQNTAFNQIDNTTYGSPIARANKLNVLANTQNALGNLTMQQQLNNNQVRAQRASIYSGLGSQDMESAYRAQQTNLSINEANAANRAAKQNLLSTGLSQLQQNYLNDKTNKGKMAMDKYRLTLLKEMFPNLKYYGQMMDYDTITGG